MALQWSRTALASTRVPMEAALRGGTPGGRTRLGYNVLDCLQQLGYLKRLLDEACHTLALKLTFHFDFAKTARKNHRNIGAQIPQFPQRFFTAHYRHRHIEHHTLNA